MEIYNGTYCVYIHTNKINGKIYVGQTVHGDNLEKRWGRNGAGYKSSPRFWSAICQYGWDGFEHEVVASRLTLDEANHFEELLIEKLDTTNLDKGYNLKSGGENNLLSDEAKQKISNAHKGKSLSEEHKKKLSEIRKDRVFSDEHKRRLSESQIGKKKHPLSDELKKKLSEAHTGHVVSLETCRKIGEANKGKTMSEESKTRNAEAHKGKRHTEETKKKMREAKKCQKRRVGQYDKNESLIKIWDGIRDAAYTLGICEQSISMCCRGVCKSAGDFVWRYFDIPFTSQNDL